eukprot:619562-Rhodomonas_salina.1
MPTPPETPMESPVSSPRYATYDATTADTSQLLERERLLAAAMLAMDMSDSDRAPSLSSSTSSSAAPSRSLSGLRSSLAGIVPAAAVRGAGVEGGGEKATSPPGYPLLIAPAESMLP